MQASSFEAARSMTSFPLYEPQGLGSPRIFLSSPRGTADAVWFVYDAPRYGRIWVGESAPDILDESERLDTYQEIVAENGKRNISGHAELVRVRGRDPALLGTSADAPATLEWVEDGVQFYVEGPTLTQDQAIAIANSL